MSTTDTPTTTGTLTLTKTSRDKLVTLFTDSTALKLKRVKGLIPYTAWTVDEIVAAIHTSADAEGLELVIESRSKSTMKRAMSVARAWVATGANDLALEDGDDTRDAVLGNLAAIADITPAALESLEVPEGEREDAKVKEWFPVIVPAGHYGPAQPEWEIDLDHGCGEGAMAGIIEDYVKARTGSAEGAAEYVRLYALAVRYTNNRKRREAQAHDTVAAGARKGDGEGENKRAPRNPGGTSKDEPAQESPAQTPAAGVPDHRLPNQKTLGEATVHELIVTLTKRVVDYSVAVFPADATAWDEMTDHWAVRFDHVPLGKTMAVLKAEQIAEAVTAQNVVNLAPAPANRDVLLRVLLAELSAKGVTPEALLSLVPAAVPVLA